MSVADQQAKCSVIPASTTNGTSDAKALGRELIHRPFTSLVSAVPLDNYDAVVAYARQLEKKLTELTDGVQMIADARKRQIEHGFTSGHDDCHDRGELVEAAACYAAYTARLTRYPGDHAEMPSAWPFERGWWKPSSDRKETLAKAGALIAAEIERLQRAEKGVTDEAKSD
jgi:hypothetical protein